MADSDFRLKITPTYGGEFTAELFQYPGKGGWTFAVVPEEYAPRVTHGWGVRGEKGHADTVRVRIEYNAL